ncbi:hypothetical protein ACIRST_40540 [Kitasatospora sp. NPDC101447]|uniref:hypothetical protein n=1 Tax=Kitasatospora sp. NPDC101447 TaxID=3364102 RepID=UPI0037F20A1F
MKDTDDGTRIAVPVEQPDDGTPFPGDLLVLRLTAPRTAPTAGHFLIADWCGGDPGSGLFEINLPAVIRHSPDGVQTLGWS